VIISHKYKFVFLHIPKTGGSSIAHEMMKMCGYVPNINHIPAEEFTLFKDLAKWGNSTDMPQHSNYGDLKRYLEDLNIDVNDYFVFTFVRNPWDWYVSSYEFGKLRYKQDKLDWAKPCADNDFETWIKTAFHKQQDYLYDQINYIGKMENMEFHLEKIRQILQTRIANVELDKVKPSIINANPHADYKTYYTEETKTLVAKRCYQIINDFHYEF
tara:strand:- start:753 stop:1394 length:642 start_codon:yes stop_codon:yes gene_type:complete